MKKILLSVALCLALLVSIVPAITSPAPAQAAAPTTTLTIKMYASDNTTVLSQTTINYSTMQTTLPVQGDGTIHYFMQGPTFDTGNLWDPNESLNLADKGPVMGTDLKDLCNLVGNITSGAPSTWVNDSYVSATPWPSSTDYAALRVYDGLVFNHANWAMNVALQVL